MNVPIHFVVEDTAPGVKLEGGVISKQFTDVEVVCLPKNLPEYLEVDVSEMQMDDILHLSDLKIPEGVEVVELTHGEGHDQPLVSISKPRAIVEETDEDAEAPEAGEVPTVAETEEPDEDKED